ncbi:hypothetical protein Tco_0456916 [Tanacetum coccineum]
MDKLVKLNIYVRLDDTWAWVASRPKRQSVAAASTLEVAKGAPDVEEGAQVVLAPVQAPQLTPTVAPTRTMTQRLSRLEEEVNSLRGDMGEQREVLDNMSRDFARFTT